MTYQKYNVTNETIYNKMKKIQFVIEKNYIYARISYKEGDSYV